MERVKSRCLERPATAGRDARASGWCRPPNSAKGNLACLVSRGPITRYVTLKRCRCRCRCRWFTVWQSNRPTDRPTNRPYSAYSCIYAPSATLHSLPPLCTLLVHTPPESHALVHALKWISSRKSRKAGGIPPTRYASHRTTHPDAQVSVSGDPRSSADKSSHSRARKEPLASATKSYVPTATPPKPPSQIHPHLLSHHQLISPFPCPCPSPSPSSLTLFPCRAPSSAASHPPPRPATPPLSPRCATRRPLRRHRSASSHRLVKLRQLSRSTATRRPSPSPRRRRGPTAPTRPASQPRTSHRHLGGPMAPVPCMVMVGRRRRRIPAPP